MNKISEFTGRYRFLSNFYICDIKYKNIQYPSVEHAYQAAKTDKIDDKIKISKIIRPGDAKRYGKRLEYSELGLGDNWHLIKTTVMYELVKYKFYNNKFLRSLLISTGNAELIEGNYWKDTFWGIDNSTGIGDNNLGKILMRVREELRNGTI